MCARHSATGSARSRRTAFSTASQSVSTSGLPNTCRAQPAFGAATIVQLTSRSLTMRPHSAATSRGRALPTRAPSRSDSSSGSGSPLTCIYAPLSAASVLSIVISQGAEVPKEASGPSSIKARVKCRSKYLDSTRDAPARYAARAISRASGAFSTWAKTTTSCPGRTSTPTETASSARRLRRLATSFTAGSSPYHWRVAASGGGILAGG